jgi:hypothetical protein
MFLVEDLMELINHFMDTLNPAIRKKVYLYVYIPIIVCIRPHDDA